MRSLTSISCLVITGLLVTGCTSSAKRNPGLYSGGLSALTAASDDSSTAASTGLGGARPQPKPSLSDKLFGPLKALAAKPEKADDFSDPEDPLSLSTRSTPESPQLFLSAARVIATSGNTQGAIALYKQTLTAYPDDRDALLELARLHVNAGEFNQASALYQRAAIAHENDAVVFNDVGLFHQQQGRMALAIRSLARAVELEPRRELYRNNLANAYVINNNAYDALDQLLAVHPKAVAHFNLGYLLYTHQNLDESVRQFELAYVNNPKMAQALVMKEQVAAVIARRAEVEATQSMLAADPIEALPAPVQSAGEAPVPFLDTESNDNVGIVRIGPLQSSSLEGTSTGSNAVQVSLQHLPAVDRTTDDTTDVDEGVEVEKLPPTTGPVLGSAVQPLPPAVGDRREVVDPMQFLKERNTPVRRSLSDL